MLDNALGVFVASAPGAEGDADPGEGGAESASGDGSMVRPYTTIAQALANLGSKARIYLCNGSYGEQVNVTTAVSVYGGLSCASGPTGRVWSYVGGSAQVISPSPLYALSVAGAATGSVTIEDVSFAAPSATAAGGSSLAALITSSAVNLVRVTLSAGSGANGAPGADGIQNPNYTGTAPDGGSQVSPGPPGSGTFQIAGGVGGLNQCTHFGVSAGGGGGYGCAADGLGSPGTATPKAPATVAGRDGLPGAGDGGASSTPVAGDPGADGLAGDGGLAAEGFGSLSATGWTPGPGKDGAPGNPGQGGAGATDPLYGLCGSPMQSVGGGGGGAGGCGGAGGNGGGGGGASIVLASVTSTIELTACTLSAAAAGSGGAGGAGQDGQAGAPGGDANFPADHAAGGAGGNGAGGSGGAGGAGGISVGILNLGSMITSDKATTLGTRVGAAGVGGAAGPAGRHSLGGLMTGMEGHSGAPGNAGTSVTVLQLM